jgi:hypothetical protein
MAIAFFLQVRFDWFDGVAANPGSLQPFGNGQRKNQMLIGADLDQVAVLVLRLPARGGATSSFTPETRATSAS